MSVLEKTIRSPHRRYFVARELLVETTVQRVADLPTVVGGRLVEISVGGGRVILPQPVQFDEKITLQLFCREKELDLRLSGVARWIRRKGQDNQFSVGCIFDSELSESQLDLFVERGLFSRREHMRYPLIVPARVRWELGGAETEVELCDISKGGVCLVSAEPADVGARVQLVMEEPGKRFQLLAQICWLEEVDGAFLIGCRFVDTKAPARVIEILQHYNSIVMDPQIRDALQELTCELESPKKPRRRLYGFLARGARS